jgi:monoamine oxidase
MLLRERVDDCSLIAGGSKKLTVMKIIIIGAGAAGLMAARILMESKHEVVVVEARDRVGGRIYTQQVGFSIPIETGAEFMHGSQPMTMSLMKEAGIKHKLLSGKRYQIWNGEIEEGDLFSDGWEKLTRALEQLDQDMPFADFLEQDFADQKYQKLRTKVRGFVEGYDAADLNRVSSMALAKEWSASDDEHQYRLEGGYSAVIAFLEDKVRKTGGQIWLSSPVTAIEWSQNNVKVMLSSGMQLEAEKVIITIPVAPLQSGAVTFSPSLPAHLNAFRQMGFGGVIKFFIEFKSAFWQERISRPLKKTAFVFSDARIPTWWTQLPNETPLLTGWLGGPGTRELSRDGYELQKVMVDSLRYVFNCSSSLIENEIAEWHVADWLNDPYALGAYSYPTINTPHARSLLSRPVKDTLYFAGEHLYDGSAMGTVEAALVNGKETAEKIQRADR